MCGLCNFGCCNHNSFHVEITEEEQEQTGGGYYPALESYLDRTSDEERSRLEQYKYTIDTNMEGGKHITTILLNNKRIFRFGYQMSGNENLIKISIRNSTRFISYVILILLVKTMKIWTS